MIAIVKGVSGSGKSSRVFQLMKFFESGGFTLENFNFINIEGKERLIGILVKEIGLIFFGRIYNSGIIQRWQGYDSVTGCFKGSKYFSEFLKDNSKKYDFIVEGAGVTGTNRLRPLFLKEYCDIGEIYLQYYNYETEQKDLYLERIFRRSGKIPEKGTMWDKHLGFKSDYNKALEELEEIDVNCIVDYKLYDEPIDDFGSKWLEFAGMVELVVDFKSFVKDFDYISKNKFENFQ